MDGALPEKVEPSAPPSEKDRLKSIAVWREDASEADRLFGDSTSYARRFNAILDVLKRERLVDKVRRKILGVEDALRRITPVILLLEVKAPAGLKGSNPRKLSEEGL